MKLSFAKGISSQKFQKSKAQHVLKFTFESRMKPRNINKNTLAKKTCNATCARKPKVPGWSPAASYVQR